MIFTQEKALFSQEKLDRIQKYQVPSHIAIIMDGNRRWAKKHHLPTFLGHWKGAENITALIKAAKELGVEIVTLFAFSTENWSRPQQEINDLMHIFKKFLEDKREMLIEKGIRFDVIGDIVKLPEDVQEAISNTKEYTKNCKDMELVVALNYSGRDDIRRAVSTMLSDVKQGELLLDDLTESSISSYLDTRKWRDPDLLVRTSGEKRISNFLLWQISYTEIYVTDVLWPDFNHEELFKAIIDYQHRERRLGG